MTLIPSKDVVYCKVKKGAIPLRLAKLSIDAFTPLGTGQVDSSNTNANLNI